MNNWKDNKIFVNYFTWQEALDNTPEGYKLPLESDFQELIDSTIYSWDEEDCNGIFTFPDGFQLILPAMGGNSDNNILLGVGSRVCYWSESPYDSENASVLYFDSDSVNGNNFTNRGNGFPAIYIKL